MPDEYQANQSEHLLSPRQKQTAPLLHVGDETHSCVKHGVSAKSTPLHLSLVLVVSSRYCNLTWSGVLGSWCLELLITWMRRPILTVSCDDGLRRPVRMPSKLHHALY